jgi:membrane dipeptidase
MAGIGTSLVLPLTAIGANASANERQHDLEPVIIDSQGAVDDPNQPPGSSEYDIAIDDRSLADARASGLTACNVTIGWYAGDDEPFETSVREVNKWNKYIANHRDRLLLVRGGNDIDRARASRRVGIILAFQNSAMMGHDLGRVSWFARHGVRVIQLTYNTRNQVGDGSMVKENAGLTSFGRELVGELNHQRVLVDLSHSGEQTCLDAIEASSSPIVISHAGCRAVTDLPRNKTDRELKRLGDRGGYVGIYFMPYLAIGRQPLAADLIQHIEHAVNVCGEDHVGIGTDGTVSKVDDLAAYRAALRAEIEKRRIAGIGATGESAEVVNFLPDLDGVEKFRKLAEMLAKRGHTSSRIDKILGKNFQRVAASVWGGSKLALDDFKSQVQRA